MSLEPTFEPFSVRSPWQWETLAMTSTGPRRRYDPSRGRGVLIFRGADDRRRDQAVLPRPKPRRTSRPAGPDPRRRTRARRPGDAAGAQPDRGEIAEQREVDGRTSSKRYRHVAPSARIFTRVLTPREHLALRLRFAHDLTQQKIGDRSGSARCGYGTSSIVASTAPQPR